MKECVLLQDVKASGPDSNYYMSNSFLLVFFGESWLIGKEEFINAFLKKSPYIFFYITDYKEFLCESAFFEF